VDVGSQVKEGDTICIVEAMKILNEIEADKTGTIVRVLGENGQAVEYGQPLFVIE
jgi:acetyl-CoA carboxylase biotin carboxyl carrier protein